MTMSDQREIYRQPMMEVLQESLAIWSLLWRNRMYVFDIGMEEPVFKEYDEYLTIHGTVFGIIVEVLALHRKIHG